MGINLKFMRAEIGVGMSILSHILLMVVSLGYLRFSFVFYILVGCVLAGMALYVSDRKGFLNRRRGDKGTAVWLAIIGLALTVITFILGLFIFLWMGWSRSVSRSWTWEDSMIEVSYLAFLGLVFLFGWLLFFDHEKIVEDKGRYLPSERRLDVETQKKYPRDLFAKYAQQYPHNPEGVLEWHIHKKVKKGKSREQAIGELRKKGGGSI